MTNDEKAMLLQLAGQLRAGNLPSDQIKVEVDIGCAISKLRKGRARKRLPATDR